MEKIAAPGTARDPFQQEVRNTKNNWNKKVSHYIWALIDFKQMFNGHPGTLLSKRTKFSESNPESLIPLAEKLKNSFNSIISEGINLIKLQNEYAAERKKTAAKKYDLIIQDKKQWNGKAKEHIKNIIEFKKYINGFPNIFSQQTKIHEELPKDPETIIQLILSDNNGLLDNAKKILNSQLEIKNKKADYMEDMIKESSNPLSRFWHNLKLIPHSFSKKPLARIKIFQQSIVSHLGDCKKKAREIEANILSPNKDADTQEELSEYKEDSLPNRLEQLSKTLVLYKQELIKFNEFSKEPITTEDEKIVKNKKSKTVSEDIPDTTDDIKNTPEISEPATSAPVAHKETTPTPIEQKPDNTSSQNETLIKDINEADLSNDSINEILELELETLKEKIKNNSFTEADYKTSVSDTINLLKGRGYEVTANEDTTDFFSNIQHYVTQQKQAK